MEFRVFRVLSVLMRLDMLMGRDSCLGEPLPCELEGVFDPSRGGELVLLLLLLWLFSGADAFRVMVEWLNDSCLSREGCCWKGGQDGSTWAW